MITIKISKQSNYPISGIKVRKFLQEFFKSNGIVSDSECHVSFVGEAKMKEIDRKYYRKRSLPSEAGKDNRIHDASSIATHNVFSFVESEVPNWKHPQGILYLGEIVVCFPVVVKEAEAEGKLIEEKVLELVGHSGLHLLGIHHEE